MHDFFKHNKFYYCLSCWNSMSNTGTGSMSSTGAEFMSSTVAESSPQYICSSTRCAKPLTGKRAHDWFKHNGEYVCADCWAKMWGPWSSCYQCTIRPVWQYVQEGLLVLELALFPLCGNTCKDYDSSVICRRLPPMRTCHCCHLIFDKQWKTLENLTSYKNTRENLPQQKKHGWHYLMEKKSKCIDVILGMQADTLPESKNDLI